MINLVVPCTEIKGSNVTFHCSLHRYDGKNDSFCCSLPVIMGNNDTLGCILQWCGENKWHVRLFSVMIWLGIMTLFIFCVINMMGIMSLFSFPAQIWLWLIRVSLSIVLIWIGLMTHLVDPCINMIGSNEDIGCKVYWYNGEKWNFIFRFTDVMVIMTILVFSCGGMMSVNDIFWWFSNWYSGDCWLFLALIWWGVMTLLFVSYTV